MDENRFHRIRSQLSPQSAQLFTQQIPAYKEGYVNYVYQTDKPDVQARRIKQMDKIFRRYLAEPYFYIQPLSQADAEEIADKWKYQAPYDFYDMTADPEDYAELIDEKARAGRYFQVIRNGVFFGFCVLEKKADALELGLGMNPAYLGQGMGTAFYQAIEKYIEENFSITKISLCVANFNQRAINVYQKMGFQTIETYRQETNGSVYDFLRMEKVLNDE